MFKPEFRVYYCHKTNSYNIEKREHEDEEFYLDLVCECVKGEDDGPNIAPHLITGYFAEEIMYLTKFGYQLVPYKEEK